MEDERTLEERNVGFIAFMTQDEIALITENGSVNYRYSGERSAEEGYSSVPEALSEEEKEGIWEDPVLGGTVAIYPWRGEFEATEGTTGDYHAGDIIYNGNPAAPEYALMIPDSTAEGGSYRYADIYFCHGADGAPRMIITIHYAEYDYHTTFIKQD